MNDRYDGPGRIPDRWLHCPRKSSTLIVNRFLAFKTPLAEKFDDQVPIQCRFTPQMVFESMRNYKVRIGLWIDLTYTSRFYDKQSIITACAEYEEEVKYVKLQCRGHGETPSVEQTSTFIKLCDQFIRSKPLEAIGVHCTHGFNRTGFLIVSFLVEELGYSLDAALLEFTKARQPGIYKPDYLQELYTRYDDIENMPPPPLLPDWHTEFDDSEYDNSGTSSHSKPEKRKMKDQSKDSSRSKRMRDTNKIPEFMEGVPGTEPVMDWEKLRELRKVTQQILNVEMRGFCGSQPVSMDLDNIHLLKRMPYRVSWKADGTRYMMLITGEKQVYCIDRDDNYFLVNGLRFVHRKNLALHLTNTLMDGEMVIDKHEGQCIPRYLVYDIIMVHNIDVSTYPFYPERVQCINIDVIKPRYQAISMGLIKKNEEPFSVRLKDFYPVEKAGSFFSEKFCKQLTHEPDGLIFQPVPNAYKAGQSPEVLKWKPPSMNSIDFRLKIVKEEGMGIVPRKIGQLFVGGLKEPFACMKISSSIKNMDSKIIECKLEKNNWVFMRERTDKSFPNHFNTAKAVLNSIKNPVTKEYLLEYIEHERFRTDQELMPPPR